VNKSTE